jgi:tetratricopeptide (TPR) repeat protein
MSRPAAAPHLRAGREHLQAGRFAEAAAALRKAAQLDPDDIDARIDLGGALVRLRQLGDAERVLRKALAQRPTDPRVLRGLADALLLAGRPEEVLALVPAGAAGPEAEAVRGDALFALSRFDEALAAFAAAAAGGGFDALIKLGIALKAAGRHGEALAAFERAAAARPDAPVARFQRSLLRLQLGELAGGWPDYEARWAYDRFVEESRGQVARGMVPALTLAPERADLDGQRLLLVGEQGIGDQVMFASTLPEVLAAAQAVTLVCEPRLVRLFSASFPQATVTGPAEARVDVAAIDRVIALGSLPHALRRTPDALPGAPYLAPRPEVVQRWADRLGPRRERLRIGVSWRGGAASTRTQARSLPLAALAPILDLPGVEAVSLQYGDVVGELAAFNAGRDRPVRAFTAAETDDFEDLAGLVANLDLVVSVQTSLVHLTGALGRPCLALIPTAAEWRYGVAGEAMAWYRSVRLLRQAEAGDWGPVIAAAVAAVDGGRRV